MTTGYKKKYFLLYLYRILSVLLGMASLFVVIPHISYNKELYGIYSICISLSVYFSYSDIGFITAGQKFASEAFITGNKEEEQNIIGFLAGILLFFMFLVSLVLAVFAYNPDLLIKGLAEESARQMAQYLLLILACSFPIYATNRVLEVIFSIRMEDYKYQGINIVGNLIRICSIFFFFAPGRYMIVEFFFFSQLIILACCVTGFIYIICNYGYRLSFLKKIKPCKVVYDKLKMMAFASVAASISTILLYELDQIFIGKIWGAETVAVYAIAFSLFSYVRLYNSILYSPFTPRMNYFIGTKDIEGLDRFTSALIVRLFPIQFFPMIIMACFAHPFIVKWAGIQYEESILIAQIIIFSFAFLFFTNPASVYIQAKEKNMMTIYNSIINAFVFWGGVFLLYKSMGMLVFPIMKVVTALLGFLYICYVMRAISNIGISRTLIKIFSSFFLPTLFCIIFSLWLSSFTEEIHLFVVLLLMGVSLVISVVIAMTFNRDTRIILINILKQTKRRFINYEE